MSFPWNDQGYSAGFPTVQAPFEQESLFGSDITPALGVNSARLRLWLWPKHETRAGWTIVSLPSYTPAEPRPTRVAPLSKAFPDLSQFVEVPLGRAHAELEQLCATRREAMSIAFAYSSILSSPRRRPGLQSIAAIAMAWESPEQGTSCRVFHLEKLSDLSKFKPLFVRDTSESSPTKAPPPYLIFSEGHEALAQFMRAGIEPSRYGCLDIATQLLHGDGETSKPMGSHSLSFSLVRAIEHELMIKLEDQGEQASSTQAAAHRAICQLPLMRSYTPKLRDLGLIRLFDLECRLLPAVVEMEANGITLDAPEFERIASHWAEQANRSDLDPAKIARFRKLISTYRWWARDYLDIDGRIRCQLRPMASESGRISCFEPNLQQVPSEHTAPGLRACFKASPGFKFIIADYAQIELRVAAHLAPCSAMREVFERQFDLHQTTAAAITGKKPNEIDPYQRQLAKAVNFGFLFGMGAKKFQEYAKKSYGVELNIEQAQHARSSFMSRYPGIQTWHQRIANAGRNIGPEGYTVRTAMGRRKHFSSQSFRFSSALNIPIQGTAAEGLKLAIIRLRPILRDLGGRALLCVHDEYIAEVPQNLAQTACDQIRITMEQAMAEVVPSVPIVVEAKVAQHWGDKSSS